MQANTTKQTPSLFAHPDQQKLDALRGQVVVIKYGGNAMLSPELQQGIVEELVWLNSHQVKIVLVHGGGPFIQEALKKYKIESEFIGGHRVTTKEAMQVVEMALRGSVNGKLVSLCRNFGLSAVGISGKDGELVTAVPRLHRETINGVTKEISLGLVGDVQKVSPKIVHTLLADGFLPIVAPVACGADGNDYNINADIFAGHLAGALQAAHYLVLTDVDGLMQDKDNPSTLIRSASVAELSSTYKKAIVGGMLPKIEGCVTALSSGAKHSYICNGTKKFGILNTLLKTERSGTQIS